MALHTKKLYYRRGGTTYSIDLYTTTTEVGAEYIALNDAGTTVYAAIVSEGSNGESYLRIRKSGITKSILSTMTAQELSALINYDISNSSSYPGSGTALTDIGEAPAMNATLYNGVGYSSEKGGVLTFDGIDDHVNVPYNSVMNAPAFTVSVWFYVPTMIGFTQWRIINRQNDGNWGRNSWGYEIARADYMGVGTSSEIVAFCHSNANVLPSVNCIGPTKISINTWYHGGFTSNGSTLNIYLNGELDNSVAGVGVATATTWPIYMGGQVYSNLFYFNGRIGQAKFFNTALTPEQVAQEFEATKTRFGFTLPLTGNVIDYSINETSSYPGSGTTVYDISESAAVHDGTLVNGVGYSSAYGGVLTFDGTNDYISITNHTDFDLGLSNEPFAIEGWIYFLSVSGQKTCLFTKGGGTDNWTSTGHQYVMFPNNGPLYWQFKSVATDGVVTSMVSNASLSINTWYHIVISYDGTTTRMYLNTAQQNSTSTASYYKPSSGAAIVRIGTTASGSAGYYAHEYLGMAKIYKGTYLTGEQVIESYNATKARFGL